MEKQRQRKPKYPQVEGNVRFQVFDRGNSLATTGTDLNSPIVRRTIEARMDYAEQKKLEGHHDRATREKTFQHPGGLKFRISFYQGPHYGLVNARLSVGNNEYEGYVWGGRQ